MVDNALSALEGDDEGGRTPLVTQRQRETSESLREHLDELASRVRKSKMKLPEKVKNLTMIVGAHEKLTKTERAHEGLDSGSPTGGLVGVIIVPAKAAPGKWAEAAYEEVEAARAEHAAETAPVVEVFSEGNEAETP